MEQAIKQPKTNDQILKEFTWLLTIFIGKFQTIINKFNKTVFLMGGARDDSTTESDGQKVDLGDVRGLDELIEVDGDIERLDYFLVENILEGDAENVTELVEARTEAEAHRNNLEDRN